MSTVTPSRTLGGFADLQDLDGRQPLPPADAKIAWAVCGALAALLVVAYWDMLAYTSTYWSKGLYSHGWIVPLIAGYLMWIRKQPLVEASPRDRWIGVAVIGVALAVRVWASVYDYNNPDRLSFIACLLGLCLVIGGEALLRWAGPCVAFLIFMFPLPAKVENTVLMKLQSLASAASTVTLQTLGVSATRQGNVLSIDTLAEPLQVAEACSGLRMLTIFGAMSVAFVMLMERPWWDKLIVLLSAIPIALLSNMIRIVVTALLFMAFGQETGWLSQLIHDWSGFAMMPIGLGLLWIEMTVLSKLTVPIDDGDYLGFAGSRGGVAMAR